jgi:RNA chaperone Hfq
MPKEDEKRKNYFMHLNHKKVTIFLVNGSSESGILHSNDQYNVEIEDGIRRILIPKHAIIKVIPVV